MPRRRELSQLLSSRVLAPEAIREASRLYRASALRLVHIREFLALDVAAPVTQFLLHEARYKQMHALYPEVRPEVTGRAPHTTREIWEQAPESERFFRFDQLLDDEALLDTGTLSSAVFRDVYAMLGSEIFRRYLETIVGRPLGGVVPDVHRMKPGDFVGPHTDDRANRRVGLLLYLSKDWTGKKGGVLHIEGAAGDPLAVLPVYNSVVVFDVGVHGRHWVTSVEPDFTRISIGAWYVHPCVGADAGGNLERPGTENVDG